MKRPIRTKSKKRGIILFCDDDNLGETLVPQFERLGFEIESRACVPAATVDLPSETSVAIVRMPKEHKCGLTVIEQTRVTRRSIPIFVLSIGSEDEGVRRAVFEAGASDVILMPFDSWELVSRVQAIVKIIDELAGPDFYGHLTGPQRLVMLADRLDVVAGGLEALRINSAEPLISEVRALGQELRGAAVPLSADGNSSVSQLMVRTEAHRSLGLLGGIYDAVGSTRGGEMIVAGAVTGLVGLGGWPTVTAYGLSLAAWMGKDAFIEAVRRLPRPTGHTRSGRKR
jgi:CheY-like chemotaxis protein